MNLPPHRSLDLSVYDLPSMAATFERQLLQSPPDDRANALRFTMGFVGFHCAQTVFTDLSLDVPLDPVGNGQYARDFLATLIEGYAQIYPPIGLHGLEWPIARQALASAYEARLAELNTVSLFRGRA